VPGIVGWSHAADRVEDEATNHRAGRQPPVNVHEEIALPWPPPIPSLAAADTPPATDGFSESALQENERRIETKKKSMGARELAACALTLLASISVTIHLRVPCFYRHQGHHCVHHLRIQVRCNQSAWCRERALVCAQIGDRVQTSHLLGSGRPFKHQVPCCLHPPKAMPLATGAAGAYPEIERTQPCRT
jgi:hypothetical protein